MIIPQIKFVFDRKHLASNNNKGVIDLRITYNRKQKFITTGVKCFPGEWDAARECIKSLNSHDFIVYLHRQMCSTVVLTVGARTFVFTNLVQR